MDGDSAFDIGDFPTPQQPQQPQQPQPQPPPHQQSHLPPQQSYPPPQQNYPPPQQSFSPPQQSYPAPQQGFAPQPVYGQPGQRPAVGGAGGWGEIAQGIGGVIQGAQGGQEGGGPDYTNQLLQGFKVVNAVAQAEGQGKHYLNQNVSFDRFRYFFDLDTNYVFKKLLIIFFPFLHRGGWTRKSQKNERDEVEFLTPRHDINSPDLYIPSMAFITYVLIVGLAMGTWGEFDPEILGITTSSGLVGVCVQVMLLKLGFYVLSPTAKSYEPTVMELIAFSGYLFAGLCLNILLIIFLSPTFYYWCTLYTSFAISWFLICSLKANLVLDPQATFASKSRIYYFLGCVGVLQFIMAFALGATPKDSSIFS